MAVNPWILMLKIASHRTKHCANFHHNKNPQKSIVYTQTGIQKQRDSVHKTNSEIIAPTLTRIKGSIAYQSLITGGLWCKNKELPKQKLFLNWISVQMNAGGPLIKERMDWAWSTLCSQIETLTNETRKIRGSEYRLKKDNNVGKMGSDCWPWLSFTPSRPSLMSLFNQSWIYRSAALTFDQIIRLLCP